LPNCLGEFGTILHTKDAAEVDTEMSSPAAFAVEVFSNRRVERDGLQPATCGLELLGNPAAKSLRLKDAGTSAVLPPAAIWSANHPHLRGISPEGKNIPVELVEFVPDFADFPSSPRLDFRFAGGKDKHLEDASSTIHPHEEIPRLAGWSRESPPNGLVPGIGIR
jgi:hypothetical protein